MRSGPGWLELWPQIGAQPWLLPVFGEFFRTRGDDCAATLGQSGCVEPMKGRISMRAAWRPSHNASFTGANTERVFDR